MTPSAFSPAGLRLEFQTLPEENSHRSINRSGLQYDPASISLSLTKIDNLTAWCYGELHSYSVDGATAECLTFALSDFIAGKLKPARLNGRFVLLIWDQLSQRWTVITDRTGAQHIYAVQGRETIKALGTDLLTLARAHSRRESDWQALIGFFTFGFFPEDRTYFTDIKILLPASIYTIDARTGDYEHQHYWQWHHAVDSGRNYNETTDEYNALLHQAVARHTAHGQIILPISGGLDSRSLAQAMPPDPQTQAYSYGYTPDSTETSIAQKIAKARSFTFTAHTIGPYLFERLPEVVRTLHGSQDVTIARQMSVNDWVREQADAVLTGLWGDVWCDQVGLADYPAVDDLPENVPLSAFAFKKIAKRGRKWLLENIAVPNVDFISSAGDARAFLEETISHNMKQFAEIEDPDFRVKAYKTANWAFRWSNASLRGFDPGGVARVPYYDTDLIDFFCTVPTDFVRDRQLQIDHLKRYAPDLARIRWQAGEANLHLAPVGWWISLPRRAVMKAQRALTNSIPIERNWEVQLLSTGQQQHLERWLLGPDLPLHQYVPPRTLSTFIEKFYNKPDVSNGYAISMLLTFSAWLTLLEQ